MCVHILATPWWKAVSKHPRDPQRRLACFVPNMESNAENQISSAEEPQRLVNSVKGVRWHLCSLRTVLVAWYYISYAWPTMASGAGIGPAFAASFMAVIAATLSTIYDPLRLPSLARQVRLAHCGGHFFAARPWRSCNQPRSGPGRARLADHLWLQHVLVSSPFLALQHSLRAHASPSCLLRRLIDHYSRGLALVAGTQVLAALARHRRFLRHPSARRAWWFACHLAQGRNWNISRDPGSKFFCSSNSHRAVQLRQG